MEINRNSNTSFTSLIPLKFYSYSEDALGNRIVTETTRENIDFGRKVILKFLSGPANDSTHKEAIKELAKRDPDYSYNMGNSGKFFRYIYGKYTKVNPSSMLKTIENNNDLFLFTGPQAANLAYLGEKIGIFTKKCLNLTAKANGIPLENTLTKKKVYKWSKEEIEFLKKNMVNTDELSDIKRMYGQSIQNSLYDKHNRVTSYLDPSSNEKKGDFVTLNVLLTPDNQVEKLAFTKTK